MSSQYLSERERRIGRKEMLSYELYNGISLGMLGETLVYLLAVRFDAGNLVLGFIPTAIYAASLVVPLFSKALEGKNLGKTLYANWMLRGLVCLAYLFLFITSGTLRTVVLLLTFVSYMLFRAIGIVSYDPIAKNLTTIHSRGKFYSTLNYAYNIMVMAAKIIASITTYFDDSLEAIVTLQMIGVVANTFASIHSRRIPCRLKYSKSSDMRIFPLFGQMFSNKDIKVRVLLKWTYFSVTIIMGMTIPFMSKKVGLPDGLVIIYSVVVSLAYIIAGYMSKHLSDATGSKPILVISSISSAVLIGMFVWFSEKMPVPIYFVIGFFMNFFIQASVIQSNQLVVSALPSENAAGFNIAVNMGAGIASIVSGLFSGWLVSAGEMIDALGEAVLLNDYSLCFLFGLVVAALGVLLTVSLKEKGAKKAKDIMSLRNLQAISELSAIENSMNSFYRRKHIMDLGEVSSAFIHGEMAKKLSSPYSRELRDLLQVIGEKRMEGYIPECIAIAEDDDNYMQVSAIETLSNFTDNRSAADCLERIFYNSKWVSAKSAAARAVSEFGVKTEMLDDIVKLANEAVHIEACVDFMIAQYNMDAGKRLFLDMFSENSLSRSDHFKQTRYSCYDALLINSNSLSRLARLYEEINSAGMFEDDDKNKEIGKKECIRIFLDDYRNLDCVDRNFENVIENAVSGNVAGLVSFSEEMLSECDRSVIFDEKMIMCAEGIGRAKDSRRELFSETDLVALMYFTVFIRNHFEEIK